MPSSSSSSSANDVLDVRWAGPCDLAPVGDVHGRRGSPRDDGLRLVPAGQAAGDKERGRVSDGCVGVAAVEEAAAARRP